MGQRHRDGPIGRYFGVLRRRDVAVERPRRQRRDLGADRPRARRGRPGLRGADRGSGARPHERKRHVRRGRRRRDLEDHRLERPLARLDPAHRHPAQRQDRQREYRLPDPRRLPEQPEHRLRRHGWPGRRHPQVDQQRRLVGGTCQLAVQSGRFRHARRQPDQSQPPLRLGLVRRQHRRRASTSRPTAAPPGSTRPRSSTTGPSPMW